MKIFTIILLATIFVLNYNNKNLICQENGPFQYISPMPYSSYVSIKNNIIIKTRGKLSRTNLSENLLIVYGEKSGRHLGKLVLTNDLKTLIFNPYLPFLHDEKVTVRLRKGLRTIYGKEIDTLKFWFRTCKNLEITNPQYIINNEFQSKKTNSPKLYSPNTATLNYPIPIVNISIKPSKGYIFTAPYNFLMILDNDGTPIFYRRLQGSLYDFTLQPNGELTYFLYPIECYGMDSSYKVIHQYSTTNGFSVDVHDLIVQPDGHYFILGKRLVDMDMSKIVAGGDTSAIIIDMGLQEFNSTGNLVFQWDAINHYKITDADSNVDLLQHEIDFVHLNSIAISSDSNIILSARNLDEITKIDHNTGKIIWRFGGKNNQFNFLNDNLGFSRQHDAKLMKNGDLSLFDNGVYHTTPFSSFVEYRLDTKNMTSTLVNRYTHDKNVFGITEGNVQELPNGNKFIGWGNTKAPVVTEIDSSNSIVYEMSFSGGSSSYRSFRFKWQTNMFSTNVDSIDFGKIAYGDSSTRYVTLYNPHDSVVTINQFYSKESSFSVKNKLPINIPGKDSVLLKVQFMPRKHGFFREKLNIRHLITNELVARQIILSGSTIKQPTPIDPPTNLIAQNIHENQIKLTWIDNSNDEDGFIIERKPGDSLSTEIFSVIDTTNANDTTYVDTTAHDSTEYSYRIFGYNIDTVSTYSNIAEAKIITSIKKNNLPNRFALYQNYPNPFNPTTVIQYQIPYSSFVTLKVYDILGKIVATLVNEKESPGTYSVDFNAMNLGNGVYFYQLKADNFVSVKKMILLK